MNRRQWLVRVAALAALLARPWKAIGFGPRFSTQTEAGPTPGLVQWMWAGGVTSTSATVVARVTGGSLPVRLRVVPVEGGSSAPIEPASADRISGIVRFQIPALRPATRYSYQVMQGTEPWREAGQLRTMGEGPHNAVVLFGSCASTGSNAAIWDTMRASRPDLLIHMGDLHYEDITRNDPARFRAAFDRVLSSPRQGALYRAVPIAYVWDDHDFGGDESNRHSPSAAAAHQAYRECVPHYPLAGQQTGTIAQAFDIGRVRVIVTDVRSGRDATSDSAAPSMLGETQRQWLFAQLESASRAAALVVWANSVPWITKADETTNHGWAPYGAERRMIADHIDRLGLTSRLLMISGDAHMVAIDDGTNSGYGPTPGRGFVVVHGASFDRWRRNKGGPYSLGSRAGRGQFGELRIEDSGERLVATVTCRDRRGRQIRRLALRMTCVDGVCTVSTPDDESASPRQGAA